MLLSVIIRGRFRDCFVLPPLPRLDDSDFVVLQKASDLKMVQTASEVETLTDFRYVPALDL